MPYQSIFSRDLFRGQTQKQTWQRVYGGLVLAQALAAAIRTVDPVRHAHSMHAYFLLGGDPGVPIVYQVERVRNSPGALGTVLNNLTALGVGLLVPVTAIGEPTSTVAPASARSRRSTPSASASTSTTALSVSIVTSRSPAA